MITQRLIHLIKPYWVRLLAAMVCMLVVAGITSLMAFMVKPVLDDIFFQKKIVHPFPAAALHHPALYR